MEKTSTQNKALIVLLFLVMCLAVFIFFTMPIKVVGGSPMLSALFVYASFFAALFGIVVLYFKDRPSQVKLLNNLVLVIIMLSCGGGIPGVLLTGIKFENSKQVHLNKHGTMTKALITDKTARSVTRRGKTRKGHELYFTYETKEGKSVSSWFVASEEEFYAVNKGDVVNAIYSTKEENVVALIISKESFDDYQEKIQEFLEKK